MSFKQINRRYNLHLRRDTAVTYIPGGDASRAKSGLVKSAKNGYVRILFDGESKTDKKNFSINSELIFHYGSE